MASRISEEHELLRDKFPGAVHADHGGNAWFLLPTYRCPPGWAKDGKAVKTLKIAFMINASYPGQQPYAFLAPKGLTFNGAAPNNVAEVPDGHCPFDGDWAQYSWTPDFPWEPAADAASGVNLVHWARSFRVRLKEGV